MIDPYSNIILNQLVAHSAYPALLHSAAAISAGTFAHGATVATVDSYQGPGTAEIVGPNLVISGGAVWDIRITLDGSQSRYPAAESIEDTLYDVSGNGTHLVASATTTRTIQAKAHPSAFHWNVCVGHSLYANLGGDRLFVPFLESDKAQLVPPPAGYTLERHEVYCPCSIPLCDTKIDPNYFLQLAGVWATDWRPGDPRLVADQMFAGDIECDGALIRGGRILIAPAALTGLDKDLAEDYTSDRNVCHDKLSTIDEQIIQSIEEQQISIIPK